MKKKKKSLKIATFLYFAEELDKYIFVCVCVDV
jgi:hypothetical protein